ncbi:hypothetical protein AHF37_05841 [Paragonimus kellicotti]|nr:hypothetical protein AHF37_05841 [Paragonimus kellicotti]
MHTRSSVRRQGGKTQGVSALKSDNFKRQKKRCIRKISSIRNPRFLLSGNGSETSYKDSHEVGKRRSSQFVTYTQDGRLFYDLYVKSGPLTPLKSCNEERVPAKFPPADFCEVSNVRRNDKSCESLEKSTTVRGHTSKQVWESDGTSSSVSFLHTGVYRQNIHMTRRQTRRMKLKSFTHRTAAQSNSPEKHCPSVEQKLKRELGVDVIPAFPSLGKRLASLNAVALINAVTTDKDICVKHRAASSPQRRHSVDTIPCEETHEDCLTDKSEDATTEPMCLSPEVARKQINKRSAGRNLRKAKAVKAARRTAMLHLTPDEQVMMSPILALLEPSTQTEPAIERYHSEHVIPLGNNKFGVQQVTRQVIHVDPAEHSHVRPNIHCASSAPMPFTSVSSISCQLSTVEPQSNCASYLYAPGTNCIPSYASPSVRIASPTQSLATWHPIPQTYIAGPLVPPVFPLYAQAMVLPPVIFPFSQPYSPFCASVDNSSALQTNLSYYACVPSSQDGLAALYSGTGQTFGTAHNFATASPAYYPLCAPREVCELHPSLYASFWYPYSGVCGALLTNQPTAPSHTLQDSSGRFSTVIQIGDQRPACDTMLSLSIDNGCESTIPPITNIGATPKALSTNTKASRVDLRNYTSVPEIQTTDTVCSSPPDMPGTPSSSIALFCPVQEQPLITTVPGISSAPTTLQKPPSKVYTNDCDDAWDWEGEAFEKLVFVQSESSPVSRFCHRAIRHRRDGILIREKDSVLLCSGPDRSNPPHVAKITALFSDPNSGTKMMALLWYYRSEQIVGNGLHDLVSNELYASRHCDTNPVDCIEDKAYVLTTNAFARFMAELKHRQFASSRAQLNRIVPERAVKPTGDLSDDAYECSHADECPDTATATNVFLCRGVYDYRLKRLCRNVNFHTFSSHNQFLSAHRVKVTEAVASNSSSIIADGFNSTSLVTDPSQEIAQKTSNDQTPSDSPVLRICLSETTDLAVAALPSTLQTPTRTGDPHHCNEGDPTQPFSGKINAELHKPTSFPTASEEQESTPVKENVSTSNVYGYTLQRTGASTCSDLYTPIHTSSQSVEVLTAYRSVCAISPFRYCQPHIPHGSTQWPPRSGLGACDPSVLDNSADLSVNWAEHGEQIALSLECRTKGSPNPTFGDPESAHRTSTVVVDSLPLSHLPLSVNTQTLHNTNDSCSTNFALNPALSLPTRYTLQNTHHQNSLVDSDSPRLVIL